jgi:predicted nucleic acid-binding protein
VSVVVSDTSPLNYLVLCEAVLVLPRLFHEVLIPPSVFAELQHGRTPTPVRDWIEARPSWLRVRAPKTLDPSLDADAGEVEAICLAREVGATALLMDDKKGRIAAERVGLAVTGTVGLLELAAVRGLVDLPEVIHRLRQTNARLAPEILDAALKRDAARREKERPRNPGRSSDPTP